MKCPNCSADGFICKTKLVDLGFDLFICGKCSACWLMDQKMLHDIFKNLPIFLRAHGLAYGNAEIEEIRLVCPMCDGFGEIHRMKVIKTGQELKVCNKCEACWTQDQLITMKTTKNLSTFFKEHDIFRQDVELGDPIILCPRCDGQGEVYNARLPNSEIKLRICEECDACWLNGSRISTKTFKDLSTFLEEYGFQYGKIRIEHL